MTENTLEVTLHKIITDKHYHDTKWPEILPVIITRLQQYETTAGVERKVGKLIDHLTVHFAEQPPFTILRLSELLSDPQQQGYCLEKPGDVVKYVNALAKVIIVSSSVTDFPEPEMSRCPQDKSRDDIPLIKIPWLQQATEQLTCSPRDNAGSDHDSHEKRGSDSEASPMKRAKLQENMDSSPLQADDSTDNMDISTGSGDGDREPSPNPSNDL